MESQFTQLMSDGSSVIYVTTGARPSGIPESGSRVYSVELCRLDVVVESCETSVEYRDSTPTVVVSGISVAYEELGPTTTVSGIRVELYALGWVAESWEIIVGMFS